MSIAVSCEGCGQRFAAPLELVGKQVGCPACSRPIAVPNPSVTPQDGFVVTCQCGGQFHAEPALIGHTLPCPSCGRSIVVSDSPSPVSPAPDSMALDEFASNETAWPTASNSGASTFGSASWQKPSRSADNAHRRMMILVSVIGGGLLAIFIVSVVIWKVVTASDVESTADASSPPSSTPIADDSKPTTSGTDSSEDTATPDSKEQDDETEVQETIAWNLYTSEHGGFMVSIPGTVKLSEQTTETSSIAFAMSHETSTLPDGSVFDISYVDLPDNDSESAKVTTLDDLVEQLVERSHGKLNNEIAFDVSGHEGREFTLDRDVEDGRIAIHARVVLVEKRAYQVIWAKMNGTVPSGDSETFLRSFRLVESNAD